MKGNGQHIHELTRIEAYLLSEKAGHPSHMHDYFWTQAEAIVRQRATVVKVAVKATKTSKSAKAKLAAVAAIAPKKPAAKAAKKVPASQLLFNEEPAAAALKSKAATSAKKKAAPTKAQKTPKTT